MDELVRHAYTEKCKAEKRLGHPVSLSVRVPSRPEEALRLGLDVILWAKEGWIDRVVACAFIGSTDGSLPYEVWRAMLPENVEIVPGMDILTGAHRDIYGMNNVAEFVYAFASAFHYRGAKNVYLFNHMDRLTGFHDKQSFRDTIKKGIIFLGDAEAYKDDKISYRQMLKSIGTLDDAQKCERRHAVTMCENLVPGIPYSSVLPIKAEDWWQKMRIEVGGGFKGRRITLLCGFQAEDDFNADDYEFMVDSVLCTGVRSGTNYPMPPKQNWKIITCDVPEGALREGSAVVSFRFKKKGGSSAILHWCEIDIAPAFAAC